MSSGFLKLQRGDAFEEVLFPDPKAAHLLMVIAYRARWQHGTSEASGLAFGQARIGDHANYGLTRKEERWARERLVKAGLATFSTSPRGTVATLTDSRVWNLGPLEKVTLDKPATKPAEKGQQSDPEKGQLFLEVNSRNRAISGSEEGTTEGPTEGQLGATNEEGKKGRTERRDAPPLVLPFASKPFLEAWDLFVSHRRELRKPLTPTAAKLQLAKLAEIGESRAVAAIRYSVGKGWTGIFEEKNAVTGAPVGARVDPREAFPVKYARES